MIAMVIFAGLVFAVTVVAFVLLATIGASREPNYLLAVRPHGRLAAMARRVLGLHVSRPSAGVPELRRGVSVRR